VAFGTALERYSAFSLDSYSGRPAWYGEEIRWFMNSIENPKPMQGRENAAKEDGVVFRFLHG